MMAPFLIVYHYQDRKKEIQLIKQIGRQYICATTKSNLYRTPSDRGSAIKK